MRASTFTDLDKELYLWFLSRYLVKDRITDNILLEKAIALQEKRGDLFNFTLSKGWLWRFKKNYNLRFANIYDESDDADKSTAKEFVQLSKMLEDNEIKTAPYNATCETIFDEEVTEWINECGETERIREDATEETDAIEDLLTRSFLRLE
ncbi:hypothetical protein K0M31_006776 [Melipona bicolor]|uniref:HTH CENPB-type domain-containing protein n=1 Tax=Melipona bicolor TaxID=60889 RepID=A0AA40FSZ8_9HYME|nr:hypothetical protein K0M31_006776 [Melipona bicolor]